MAAVVVVRVGSVPDERLRREVEIARPRHGPESGPGPAEEGVVPTQTLEHGAPQEVLDVALDDRAVRQRETESSALERNGGSNADHHGRMLAQRRDIKRCGGQVRLIRTFTLPA